MNPLFRLRSFGQSPWLDYIRRGLITSGGLKRLVDEYAVAGVTSSPTILNRAISGSTDYDGALRSLVESGELDPKAIFLRLAVEDIGMTASYHIRSNSRRRSLMFEGLRPATRRAPPLRPGLPAV